MQSERVVDSNQENGFVNRLRIEWEWDIEVYPREVPFPTPYKGDEIVSVTYTYIENSVEHTITIYP